MKDRGGATLKEIEAEYEICNFAATCAITRTSSEGKQDCREIVSRPLLVADRFKFGIVVAWSVKDNNVVDESKNLGIHVKRLDEGQEPCTICLEMTVINKKGKLITLTDRAYHNIPAGKARGWSRSFDLPDRRRHEGIEGLPMSEVFDERTGWLHNGALRVSAKITVVMSPDSVGSSASLSEAGGPQEVCDSLEALLVSGIMADVTIRVKDERIQAHSVILSARSPFFAGMFSCGLKESREREFHIQDLEAPAVHAMMSFIYTGSVKKGVLENDEHCSALLMAAHRFEMPGLVQRCVQVLSSRLDVETVADRLQVADLISSSSFKAQCLEFMKTRLPEVQATESYARLVEQRPALLKDIIEVMHPPAKRRRTKSGKA